MAKSARRPRDDDEDDEDDRPKRRARRRDEEDEDDLPPGTPRVYVHDACKGKTRMPADVIAEYLDNPFELGESPTTHCTRCREDVSWKKCRWTETGQNLYEYLDDMRAEMVISGNDPRPEKPPLNWFLVLLAAAVGAGAGAGFGKTLGQTRVLVGAAGAVLGALGGVVWMFVERANNTRAFEAWNDKLVKRYYKRHPEAKKKGKARRLRDDE